VDGAIALPLNSLLCRYREKYMEQIQEINSLRIYSKIFGNRLSIVLPESFDFRDVEVIIIPREEK